MLADGLPSSALQWLLAREKSTVGFLVRKAEKTDEITMTHFPQVLVGVPDGFRVIAILVQACHQLLYVLFNLLKLSAIDCLAVCG